LKDKICESNTGLSCGGFKSLAAARQYAREESAIAWDIFHGNTLVERHDPRADRASRSIDLRSSR
jgi:hypothetical protein